MLLSLGINDLVHFDFLDPPPAQALIMSLEQLYALGALNDRGELTKMGRRMAEFPLDPMQSKALIASEEYGCSEEVLSIIAMLSAGSQIFFRPKDKAAQADVQRKAFVRPFGDHMTLLNVYRQWADTNFSTQYCHESFIQHRSMKRAKDVRDQIQGLMERVEIEPSSSNDPIKIRKALASGFFFNTAILQRSGEYKTLKHQQHVLIHPSSTLIEDVPRAVIYNEVVYTSKDYMRDVLEIDLEWMAELAPHFYRKQDLQRKGVVAAKMKMPKQQRRVVS